MKFRKECRHIYFECCKLPVLGLVLNVNKHSKQDLCFTVSCVIWEGSEVKKVELTGIDIGWTIIEKVDNIPESSDYILIGLVFSLIIGCIPVMFKVYHTKDIYNLIDLHAFVDLLWSLNADSWRFVVMRFTDYNN